MNTDALLTLSQWLSASFPVSAYAYSHGLEKAIDDGRVGNADDLFLWTEDVILHGSGRNDAILLASAYQAEPEVLRQLDSTARAFAASSERLIETTQQGAAFASTLNAIWGTDIEPLCYPLVVGRAARLKDLPLDATVALFVQAFAASLVSAAVRLVPLGQTEGQCVLAKLSTAIQNASDNALTSEIDDMSSICFALDIAAMQHETQYSKVFRT